MKFRQQSLRKKTGHAESLMINSLCKYESNKYISKENEKKTSMLESVCKVEVGTGYLRGIPKHHPQMEVELELEGNKNSFFKYVSTKNQPR